jgi:hypothetical protein
MKRYLQHQRSTTRRGAVLIVVLAMLALFAVIGLSFVLYAESQANMAESNKRSFSDENGDTDTFLDAQPEKAAEFWIGNLIYGLDSFNDDLMNPLRGHSLAEGKYGAWRPGVQGQPSLFPFSGGAVQAEPGPINILDYGTIDRRDVINYTYQRNPITLTNPFVVDPERYYGAAVIRQGPTAHTMAMTGAYVNHAVPYTYPDRQANLFLALQDQMTGAILSPSFYRPDLLQIKDPLGGINDLFTLSNMSQAQLLTNPIYAPILKNKLKTLRPTRVDHPNFPAVPQNSDGTYTGDVQNMKFLSGNQKNDSFWMDGGGPVLTYRGRRVKAMIAPLILDLNNKVNLSIAGNIRAVDPTVVTDGAKHTSQEGMGPWEVNPARVGINPTGPGPGEPELTALMRKRFVTSENTPSMLAPLRGTQLSKAITPTYSRNGQNAWINDGQPAPMYSSIGIDGVSPVPSASPTPDAMTLPAATSASMFPNFPNTKYTTTTSATPTTWNERINLHPHLYNPFLYYRGTQQTNAALDRPFGLDDVVKHGVRLNDSSNRWNSTAMASGAPSSLSNVQARLMTTGFNASQQLPALPILCGPSASGNTTNLAPIDVNRELFDYRKNKTIPLSPVNIWSPVVPGEDVHFNKARQDRQTLARDIFVRLAALATFDDTNVNDNYPVVDGSRVFYDLASGYLSITLNPATPIQLKQLVVLRDMAQLAANMVDLIDHDDIATAFVWNPDMSSAMWTSTVNTPALDPSGDGANFQLADIQYRTLYGTEMPRLVLNEVYNCVANDRNDPFAPMMRSQNPLKRRYFIELHNPMPLDTTQPERYAARLKYQSGVSQVLDQNGALVAYPGATFNPYQIDIAVGAPFVPGTPQLPFTTVLVTDPQLIAADHTVAATAIPGTTLQASIRTFTHSPTAPAPPSAVAGTDNINLVLPYNSLNPVQGSNNGFYVLGPHKGTGMNEVFPNTAQSLSTVDPVAGIPAATAPVDSLSFDATGGAPMAGDITTEAGKTSLILLRRLMNPYMPYAAPSATNPGNPYITVDYLENIPTRNRAERDSAGTDAGGTTNTAGTQGRVHPYAAAPTYNNAASAVRDHTATIPGPAAANQPFDSFFSHNENAQNNRSNGTPPNKGFEWMVHFDRKLINSIELLHVGVSSPARLTQRFAAVNNPSFGMGGNTDAFLYHYHTRANDLAATTLPLLLDTVNQPYLYKALEFLTCGSLLPNTPVGWREPGKMNINGFTREELLQAAADAQSTNKFTAIPHVQNAFGALLSSRSPGVGLPTPVPVGTPRSTFSETGVPTDDHPITAFGGGLFPVKTTTLNETILRSGSNMVISRTAAEYTNDHPYTNYEMLRKTWNSLNTVSDSFLVIMTVSFFEVENSATYSVLAPPVLGREVYSVTPGDLRVQFAGILDRSNLAMSVAPGTGVLSYGMTATIQDTDPWQIKVVEDVHPGATSICVEATFVGPSSAYVNRLGTSHGLTPGASYRLGHGNGSLTTPVNQQNGDGEIVRILPIGGPVPITQRELPKPDNTPDPVPNQVKLLIDTGTTPIARFHAAGSPLSATILGNPGPQQNKPTLEQLRQRQLMPYFTRLLP